LVSSFQQHRSISPASQWPFPNISARAESTRCEDPRADCLVCSCNHRHLRLSRGLGSVQRRQESEKCEIGIHELCFNLWRAKRVSHQRVLWYCYRNFAKSISFRQSARNHCGNQRWCFWFDVSESCSPWSYAPHARRSPPQELHDAYVHVRPCGSVAPRLQHVRSLLVRSANNKYSDDPREREPSGRILSFCWHLRVLGFAHGTSQVLSQCSRWFSDKSNRRPSGQPRKCGVRVVSAPVEPFSLSSVVLQ
jgi:hypothetical protein